MSCNKDRFINRNGQVMGEFGTVQIALRGPGCINGTGRCNVAGARGRCTNVFGTGDEIDRSDNVMGTGGRCCDRFDDEVLGTGRQRCERFINEVLGSGGRRNHHNDVMGTGDRRRHRDCDCCECLETPITVPR
ncbi:MAG: hypothetical protein K0R07_1622 [Sedimentibacter sp.]|jgi:hypothetical protein|nr:hypothetical protein [Sedimentibacter sp.]